MLELLKQLTGNDVDVSRIKSEVMAKNYAMLLRNKLYGAIRYGSYIESYGNYDTFREFCDRATEDELVELEQMYLMDINNRQHSKIAQAFIPNQILTQIQPFQWKQIHKRDIQQFYDYATSKGWLSLD